MTKLRRVFNFKTAVALVVTFAVLTVFVGAAQARPLMPGDPEVREIKFQIGSKQYTVQDGTGPVQTFDMDVAPYLKQVGTGYRVMMPFRFVGEAMGASEIKYLTANPSYPTGKVEIQRPIRTSPEDTIYYSDIIVYPGTKEITMGFKSQEMDVATEIINGRTFIPLRAAAQGLGGLVFWDSKTETVTIVTPNTPIPSTMKKKIVDGNTFYVDRATITKNSNKITAEYLTLKTKTVLTTEYPILQPSPGNPKLYVIDAIQTFKTMFGPVSDQQILVDPVRKAVMLANGQTYHPYAQIYITSTGEGDYWIGPTQVRTEHKQNSMFDKKAYMTPDGRILTELTGFDLGIAVFDHKDEITSFDGTTLVADIKSNF
jgi:hypothetical protein